MPNKNKNLLKVFNTNNNNNNNNNNNAMFPALYTHFTIP